MTLAKQDPTVETVQAAARLQQPSPKRTEQSVDTYPLAQSLIAESGISSEGKAEISCAISDRHKAGIEKYGTPLLTHDTRSAIADEIQELLDAYRYAVRTHLQCMIDGNTGGAERALFRAKVLLGLLDGERFVSITQTMRQAKAGAIMGSVMSEWPSPIPRTSTEMATCDEPDCDKRFDLDAPLSYGRDETTDRTLCRTCWDALNRNPEDWPVCERENCNAQYCPDDPDSFWQLHDPSGKLITVCRGCAATRF